MNLYMSDPRQRDSAVGQQPRGRRRQAPPGKPRVDPVPELKAIASDPPMQPTPTDDPAVEKDAKHCIAAISPVTLKADDQLTALRDRQRLRGSPRHPRSQVLPAFGHRSGELVGIPGGPSAEKQASRAGEALRQNLIAVGHPLNLPTAHPSAQPSVPDLTFDGNQRYPRR
ncbi:MAG: hypothetical protein WCB67_12560 [Solirubrobacteraceae bacterium]